MPNEFKEQMREAVERGETTPLEAYEHVRDVALDQADLQRKAAKENPEPTRAGETNEAEVLQTYVLQLLGTRSHSGVYVIGPHFLRETEENLSDLLPDGYSVKVKEWDA